MFINWDRYYCAMMLDSESEIKFIETLKDLAQKALEGTDELRIYTVQRGDTLESVCMNVESEWEYALAKWMQLYDSEHIQLSEWEKRMQKSISGNACQEMIREKWISIGMYE